jgi:3-polyprenyl-4-hydroxybenzoate decarboxylase
MTCFRPGRGRKMGSVTTWIRSQRATAVDVDGGVVLVGRDGVVRRLDGASGDLARTVLDFVARAHTADDVVAHVAALAGGVDDPAPIHQLLALLAETGAIAEPREMPAVAPANVVVAVSGAIAATHAPALVSALQRRGHAVEVALTPTAQRFVAVDALCAILHREPHTSMWPRAAHAPVPHVALAEWADLVVVYPASATTIARIARGDMSDLVAAVALTTRAPVVVAPSMNVAMRDAPAVRRNLDQLRGDGFAIVHGVPSEETADPPSTRRALASAAPAPGDVVATIEALRGLGMLRSPARRWDAAYRALVPWQPDAADPDVVDALAAHAPPPRTLLDVGCGLGHVARHAAAAGYRTVATDISEVALAMARSRGGDVVWVRDDICASALMGPFDVVVDRAVMHALPRSRAAAWAAAIDRLAADIVIVKAHRDATAATTGWSPDALAALLPRLSLVAARDTELPRGDDPTPVPATLAVFRRAD